MKRVLGLALYGPLAASTRYRLGQFVEGLVSYGIQLEIRSLLGDDYLRQRFAGRRISPAVLVRAIARRSVDLLHQHRFDASMVHCELMPLLPGVLEAALLRKPYVYDFDDAFYLKYRQGRLGILKPLLANKFDRVVRAAAQITAGNQVLADYAMQHNERTQLLPTVVDTSRYLPGLAAKSDVYTIGWIGSPSTAPYLSQVVQPLCTLAGEGRIRFVVIGGAAPSIEGVEVVELPWSEADEVRQIGQFDVGVMPLPDDLWARGKCAFKLIQYMACGVPVVASPVGANRDVVTAETGLLASDSLEWVQALRALRDDRARRLRMGDAGRARVETHYSLKRNLPVLATAISAAVSA